MNKLIIIGNLTADPVLRSTATGISVCTFTVAVNRRKNANGEQQTDFFRVSAWRERGETCAKYLSKGKKVCVTGPVTVSSGISNQTGKQYANLEVTADEVEFLTPRAETIPAPEAPQIDQASGMEVAEVSDDELPF